MVFAGLFVAVTLDSIRSAPGFDSVYKKPIGQRMEFFARQFIGTPYVGFTLDKNPESEVCTVVLDGLDCVTFMETSLGLARTINPTEDALINAVSFTRYWNGKVNGYLSRLHYTSDWIFDNHRKKVVTDLSKSLPGAERFTKKVGYMTLNPGKYPTLRSNPRQMPTLKGIEARSNKREKWFIPLSAVVEAEKQLETGDIIALCGGPEGIDCTHVGLIIRENGIPHFVHASSTAKKVIFDRPLSEYLKGSKQNIGFMVARPIENLKL
jgi:hypothetical protein